MLQVDYQLIQKIKTFFRRKKYLTLPEKGIQMRKSESVNFLKINRLKIVLAELEISQADLAERIGKSKVTVSRICNNKTQPSLELLLQISIELGVDIKELLYSTDQIAKN